MLTNIRCVIHIIPYFALGISYCPESVDSKLGNSFKNGRICSICTYFVVAHGESPRRLNSLAIHTRSRALRSLCAGVKLLLQQFRFGTYSAKHFYQIDSA